MDCLICDRPCPQPGDLFCSSWCRTEYTLTHRVIDDEPTIRDAGSGAAET